MPKQMISGYDFLGDRGMVGLQSLFGLWRETSAPWSEWEAFNQAINAGLPVKRNDCG